MALDSSKIFYGFLNVITTAVRREIWMQANSSRMEFAAQQFAISSKLLVLKVPSQEICLQ